MTDFADSRLLAILYSPQCGEWNCRRMHQPWIERAATHSADQYWRGQFTLHQSVTIFSSAYNVPYLMARGMILEEHARIERIAARRRGEQNG